MDGELRLKGPQCFLGYTDPAQDGAAFDDQGWFRTGDLGEIDSRGNVRITGRLKDIIIRNAENISALEIGDILLRHPHIADVAVIGLPDERTGERVCAVVVPETGRTITLAECPATARPGDGTAEAPRAARDHRRPAPQPHGQGLTQQLRDRFAGPGQVGHEPA